MTTAVRPGSGVALVRSIAELLRWRRRRRRRVDVWVGRKREEMLKGIRSSCEWSVDQIGDRLAAAVVLEHLVGPGDESSLDRGFGDEGQGIGVLAQLWGDEG